MAWLSLKALGRSAPEISGDYQCSSQFVAQVYLPVPSLRMVFRRLKHPPSISDDGILVDTHYANMIGVVPRSGGTLAVLDLHYSCRLVEPF